MMGLPQLQATDRAADGSRDSKHLPASCRDDFRTTDWQYCMRREMQEILPGLYLGPNAAASRANRERLEQAGITDLVLVRQEVESRVMRPNFPNAFRYLEIQLPSVNFADIIAQLPRACAFLDACFARGGRALVYCSDGISRGPAIVVGYLMHKRCLPFPDAVDFVQKLFNYNMCYSDSMGMARRLCINLTGDLQNQLREYEPICRAMRVATARGESSAGSGRNNDKKRPREEYDDEDCDDVLVDINDDDENNHHHQQHHRQCENGDGSDGGGGDSELPRPRRRPREPGAAKRVPSLLAMPEPMDEL
ncbi:unnamed protein product [Notodromas monacha]|uniref:Uncharacterized protein n=1 Tax=Notodromas monacha TaxID=399045 RepID=A0A7R9GAD7_9CRUS|nr:unnamed protein product [Notodromas monacha]CAG0915235.1 unnamed protein product [Notodromas monacha]